jgi:transposase
MGKPLLKDLRSRLVTAVAGGLSRRAAAERSGVPAATAVHLVRAVNTTGTGFRPGAHIVAAVPAVMEILQPFSHQAVN